MNDRPELFRGNRVLLACAYWAFVLYVFVPLILMILMGFKDSQFHRLPDPVLDAGMVYRCLCDTEVLFTFGYSVAIAVLSTVISILVGVWIAVLLEGRKFWGAA